MNIPGTTRRLPVLEYLRRHVSGSLSPGDTTHMRYPTAISELLGFRIVAAGEAMATIELETDPRLHGNQQGTVHGGLLCELADAAIGTAHSTLIGEDESFASIDLKAVFLRPVWQSRLRAHAWAEHRGRTLSHYRCEIMREDGKAVARMDSTLMTLRGSDAKGR
ncbi:PaaI family thioesterase [Pseudoxanthomonas putridarboris]|uniref:PaaI family thioesterase n=1 Tax=Pseudoxanthomonas putridarboris TaxID=752605 RepID=A0ABU9J0S3_9GAMM